MAFFSAALSANLEVPLPLSIVGIRVLGFWDDLLVLLSLVAILTLLNVTGWASISSPGTFVEPRARIWVTDMPARDTMLKPAWQTGDTMKTVLSYFA